MAEKAMAAQKTILAVAIGTTAKSIDIKSNPPPSGVRPYINGLIDKLAAEGFPIGDAGHYVIDYRECPEAAINNAANFTPRAGFPTDYLILAMSTTVVWAAWNFHKTTKIVGMVSNAKAMGVDIKNIPNICGVSGRRSQLARDGYDRFLATVPSIETGNQTVYLLHKQGYGPGLDSLGGILDNNSANIELISVTEPSTIQQKIAAITGAGGLLVLPADWFFAEQDHITQWARAKNLPDFWPVTDWVSSAATSALGGYGVPQKKCGELLAGRITHIWATGNVPPKKFIDAKNTDATWVASIAAAASLRVNLGNPPGLQKI